MEAKAGLIVGAQRRSWLSSSPARSAYTTLQISFFYEGLSAIFDYPRTTAVLINNFKNYLMSHQSFDLQTSGTCNQGCRRALLSTPFPSVTTAPRISNVRLGIFNNNQTHSIRLFNSYNNDIKCSLAYGQFLERTRTKIVAANEWEAIIIILSSPCSSIHREVVKNGLFTVRLTARGGSAPSALTVSKCGPIFPIIKW